MPSGEMNSRPARHLFRSDFPLQLLILSRSASHQAQAPAAPSALRDAHAEPRRRAACDGGARRRSVPMASRAPLERTQPRVLVTARWKARRKANSCCSVSSISSLSHEPAVTTPPDTGSALLHYSNSGRPRAPSGRQAPNPGGQGRVGTAGQDGGGREGWQAQGAEEREARRFSRWLPRHFEVISRDFHGHIPTTGTSYFVVWRRRGEAAL